MEGHIRFVLEVQTDPVKNQPGSTSVIVTVLLVCRIIYHSDSSNSVRDESSVFKISKIDSPKRILIDDLQPDLDYQVRTGLWGAGEEGVGGKDSVIFTAPAYYKKIFLTKLSIRE